MVVQCMKKSQLRLLISGIILLLLIPIIFIRELFQLLPPWLQCVIIFLTCTGFVLIVLFIVNLVRDKRTYVGSKDEADILVNNKEDAMQILNKNLAKNDFELIDIGITQEVYKQKDQEKYYLYCKGDKLQKVFDYFNKIVLDVYPTVVIWLDNEDIDEDVSYNFEFVEEAKTYYFLSLDFGKKKCTLPTDPFAYQYSHRKLVLKLFKDILDFDSIN